MADALASGASDRKIVGVQVPPRPPDFGERPTNPEKMIPATTSRPGLTADRTIRGDEALELVRMAMRIADVDRIAGDDVGERSVDDDARHDSLCNE